MKWATVATITFLAFFYMVTSSIGISVYSKCDAMKGKKIQENLNKYLAATLTIGLTIPATLILSKFVMGSSQETGIFMLIYSLMGLIGSAAALNWTVRCPEAKKDEKGYAAFTLTLFIITLFSSLYMLRPKSSPPLSV